MERLAQVEAGGGTSLGAATTAAEALLAQARPTPEPGSTRAERTTQ